MALADVCVQGSKLSHIQGQPKLAVLLASTTYGRVIQPRLDLKAKSESRISPHEEIAAGEQLVNADRTVLEDLGIYNSPQHSIDQSETDHRMTDGCDNIHPNVAAPLQPSLTKCRRTIPLSPPPRATLRQHANWAKIFIIKHVPLEIMSSSTHFDSNVQVTESTESCPTEGLATPGLSAMVFGPAYGG
ncbi:hypothetical protein SODALDRAFT_356480 [Sodiomyces alkalinus F11]|uniref:Uncharacterized protein n=1 Tax=Sodiomyces alkalinus (strain CBS 110278 / VKM F-3762 / F11) TaxID=1314773 RepID=A0A3N2Q153_SODAK|nr:hypothetical protein SODALDRAFT_356480 [Sodiomyces alkalinus F11]ROT40489.1 hypothetical protein SODALDRAFT_356480 [Sodiomyces alkalinus F11]